MGASAVPNGDRRVRVRASAASPEELTGERLPFLSVSLDTLQRLTDARKLGFSREELSRLKEHFTHEGRDPTVVELAGLAQSWSEHCSYKSSKPVLKQHFSGLKDNARALAMGDAGVMPFDREWAYALRIESHNHPSAIEPYGGAATGIGGILRDVLAMGAKPIALADPLFFGPLGYDTSALPKGLKHPRYLFHYVVSGIQDYGNRVGVPTVTGSIGFDPEYLVNPLVNVACVGIVRRKDLVVNRATAEGQRLILAGGSTGRDGIGGVAFASRELTKKSEQESRPAVQLGNPIVKEPLIHACLEAVQAGLVAGMKDLGGGGLATSSGELVHAGGFGSEIHLDRVPLRERGLEPWEVWISESQERMLLAVEPTHEREVLNIFRHHGVDAVVIGTVIAPGRERLYWGSDLVADLDIEFRVDPPLLNRPTAARDPMPLQVAPEPTESLEAVLTAMLLDPNGASREPVIRLYDHEVQARTVGKPLVGNPRTPSHGDASALRVTPDSFQGLALAVGSAPRVGALDPERGAALAVEEAARNLYAIGARPDALTNCLNFGNPEQPRVMGDFHRSVRGLARAASDLGMAVPSGNVSFYNGGLGEEIPPTPVVLAVGIHPDLRRLVTSDLKKEGNLLYALGATDPSLGGSHYLRVWGGQESTVPPYAAPAVRNLGESLVTLGQQGLLRSAHDVSEGGLGVALAEMAFGGGLGFDVELATSAGMPFWRALLAEGGPRWVLEVDPSQRAGVERALAGTAHAYLGRTTHQGGIIRSGGKVRVNLELEAIYPRWREILHNLG